MHNNIKLKLFLALLSSVHLSMAIRLGDNPDVEKTDAAIEFKYAQLKAKMGTANSETERLQNPKILAELQDRLDAINESVKNLEEIDEKDLITQIHKWLVSVGLHK